MFRRDATSDNRAYLDFIHSVQIPLQGTSDTPRNVRLCEK